MNKLIDRFINCLHWFDMFVPGRKDHIDWKHVGQMRSRLVKMRFGDKANTVALEPQSISAGSMLVNFRTMNGKARDRQALSRWYGKECITTKENELAARIEATRRAQEARQTAGNLPAITEEEVEAVYEVQQPQMSKEAEDKLADFLSGTTDDINEILFTSLGDVSSPETTIKHSVENDSSTNGLASKFKRLSRTSKPAPAEEISHNMDVIAALEQAVKLDATASPASSASLEPVSLPIDNYLQPEFSTDASDEVENKSCTNITEARTRKVVSLKSRSRR